MKKTIAALFQSPDQVVPLPKHLWDSACSCCDKMQARWALRTTLLVASEADPIVFCSGCFLYESAWAQENRGKVKKLAKDVEIERHKRFDRDKNGHLCVPDDCNRLAAAVALSQRLVSTRAKSMLAAIKEQR